MRESETLGQECSRWEGAKLGEFDSAAEIDPLVAARPDEDLGSVAVVDDERSVELRGQQHRCRAAGFVLGDAEAWSEDARANDSGRLVFERPKLDCVVAAGRLFRAATWSGEDARRWLQAGHQLVRARSQNRSPSCQTGTVPAGQTSCVVGPRSLANSQAVPTSACPAKGSSEAGV